MLETLLYGLFKGAREVVKKTSMKVSPVMEVLFFYTLMSFFFVLFDIKNAMGITDYRMYFFIFIKSFVIFCAWILSFRAIKYLPISLYGVLDLSRMLFATLIAVLFLHEVMRTMQWIGLVIVAVGLLLLKAPTKKADPEKEGEKVPAKFVWMSLISCLLNAVSGILDKVLTRTVTSAQLQFWYLLFLTLLYGAYILIRKEEISVKRAVTNKWLWILAILFVIADRSLFMANANPESQVTVMTLMKQSACVVTLLAGQFLYHEEHVLRRAVCTLIVVIGILIGVI
ncbi:MAG: EamA family transporter [Lachnospiraceae bacterium]|nr:EamA family transporter [Lachnospiraceae bacterium]